MIELFKNIPKVKAVMSHRKDGDMRLNPDEQGNIIENANRGIFLSKNFNHHEMRSALIEHSNRVMIVDEKSPKYLECDGLITSCSGLPISVTVADCIPVAYFDPENRVAAATHNGWKVIAKNIVKPTIAEMEKIGARRNSIVAAIGPGICEYHFEFDLKDFHLFGRWAKKKYIHHAKGDKIYIDLRKMLTDQLEKEGITKIEMVNDCTYCHPERYFSYRIDKIYPPKAMIMAVEIL
jgi:polyphenol oxidase